MRIKNLEHTQFLKTQQEIVGVLNEVGLPALFTNTFSDIDKITQQNEYINNDIRFWVAGPLPEFDWIPVWGYDLLKDKALLESGTTLQYEGPNNTRRLEVCKIEHVQPGLITSEIPLLTVVLVQKQSTTQELETLRLLIEELPWICILEYDCPISPDLKKEIDQKTICLDLLTLTESPVNIWNMFDEKGIEKKSIFQNLINVFRLKKIIKTTTLITSKEQGNIISKKSITQQKLNMIPDNRNNSATEIITKIKQTIQQTGSNFEKSTITSTELFINSIQHNGIKKFADELSTQNIPFQETIRSKNIELQIDSKFEAEIKQSLYTLIQKKCNTDVQICIDTLHVLEKEIEHLLEEQGVVFQRTNMKYITQNEIDYFLNQTFNKKIEYSGTAPNKGLYEYFSAARKFQMIFFMMASVFGVSGLIRKYQYVSIPLSIVLLGYGIINVSKSVAKERSENEEKENKSAKESIDRWIKDISSDLTRNWSKTVIDAFKTQLNVLGTETEYTLKSTLQQKSVEMEDARKKQQKSIQIFEQTERKLESVNRSIQNIERNLQRNVLDQKSAYNQLARAERDRNRESSITSERRSVRSERRSES